MPLLVGVYTQLVAIVGISFSLTKIVFSLSNRFDQWFTMDTNLVRKKEVDKSSGVMSVKLEDRVLAKWTDENVNLHLIC